MTSQMFGGSAQSGNSHQSQESCGILSAQTGSGGRRTRPLLSTPHPRGDRPSPVALPPPFSDPGPQPAWTKQDPLPSTLQETSDIPKKPGMQRARGHHKRRNRLQPAGRFQASSPQTWNIWKSVLHPVGFTGVSARSQIPKSHPPDPAGAATGAPAQPTSPPELCRRSRRTGQLRFQLPTRNPSRWNKVKSWSNGGIQETEGLAWKKGSIHG